MTFLPIDEILNKLSIFRDVKSNEKETKKDQNNRGKNQRGKDGRANNKRVNPNLVQTMGFLSEGIADGAHSKRGKFFIDLNVLNKGP